MLIRKLSAVAAGILAAGSIAFAAGALEGMYESNGITMEFQPDGNVVVHVAAANLDISATYAMDGDTLTITSPAEDTGGCPGAVGVYTVAETDHDVTFTLVEDSCQARADAFSGSPWMMHSE